MSHAISTPGQDDVDPGVATGYRRSGKRRRRLRVVPAMLLVVSIGISVYLIATRVLTHNIRNNDIVAHLFQAHVFLTGRLWEPSPPMREAFDTTMVINNGRMYSKYEPGHSAMLALGMRLGLGPKVLVALLAALNALLIYRIGMLLWGDRTVGLVTLVILHTSTFYMLAGSTLLPHTTLLFWNALFLLLFILAWRRESIACAAGSGLALGAAFLARPLGALSFAAPAGLALLWRALGVAPRRRRPFVRWLGSRRRLVMLAACGAGLAVGVALLLAYNRALTGDPFTLPRAQWDAADRLHLGFVHSWRALLHRYYDKHLYVMWFLADHLFPVAMGFQILVALFLLVSRDRGSLLLVAIVLVHPLPFMAYYYYGDFWNTGQIGPRYLYSMMLPLSLMSARVVVELYRKIGRHGRWGRWPVAAALVFLVAESAIRADLPRWLEHASWNTRHRESLLEQVMPPAGERALVFVDRRWLGEPDGVFWNRPPLFEDDVVFARFLGPAYSLDLRRRLFPDRPIYAGKTIVDVESFVPAWDLLGPFASEFPASLGDARIDETDPLAPLPAELDAAWTLFWPALPVVDFQRAFGWKVEQAMAYARATIEAERDMQVVLRYGSDDGIVIWLNGEQLMREHANRGAQFDQGAVGAGLLAGPNQLLVKVTQGSNLWQFLLRVTDERGMRPAGLVFTTEALREQANDAPSAPER